MSIPPVYRNDLDEGNLQDHSNLKLSVTNKTNSLYSLSELSVEKIKEMQETVTSLKSELQCIVVKVEQNVGMFKGKIAGKIALVLNLLKKKQTHIQNTLHNCYKIIDNLVETFLNVGYELEKDITLISLKVNDFDNEIKKMLSGCNEKCMNDTVWFVNGEGRLTKRKNVVLTSALPRFKCGDKKMRKSFVLYLADVFTAFQVPDDLWVKLASNRLSGMAQDWWKMQNKDIKWPEFAESFIDWSFNDNGLRKFAARQAGGEFNRNANKESISKRTSDSTLTNKKPEFLFMTKSTYTLDANDSDTDHLSSASSTRSDFNLSQKRKMSIFRSQNKSEKKRKLDGVYDETIKSGYKKGRYKLRKRK